MTAEKDHDMKTLQDIRNAIAVVEATAKNDHEAAHCDEDQIYREILRLIAEGTFATKEEMQEAAALGVQLSKIEYNRWYA